MKTSMMGALTPTADEPPTTEHLAEMLAIRSADAFAFYRRIRSVILQSRHRAELRWGLDVAIDYIASAKREGDRYTGGQTDAEWACEEMLRYLTGAQLIGLRLDLQSFVHDDEPDAMVWVGIALDQYRCGDRDDPDSPHTKWPAYAQDWESPYQDGWSRSHARRAHVLQEIVWAIEDDANPWNTLRDIERAPDLRTAAHALEHGQQWLSKRKPCQTRPARRRSGSRERRPRHRARAGASSRTSGTDPGDPDPAANRLAHAGGAR